MVCEHTKLYRQDNKYTRWNKKFRGKRTGIIYKIYPYLLKPKPLLKNELCINIQQREILLMYHHMNKTVR